VIIAVVAVAAGGMLIFTCAGVVGLGLMWTWAVPRPALDRQAAAPQAAEAVARPPDFEFEPDKGPPPLAKLPPREPDAPFQPDPPLAKLPPREPDAPFKPESPPPKGPPKNDGPPLLKGPPNNERPPEPREPPKDEGPPLPAFQEAPNPFREGTQTKLRAVRTFKAPGNAVQLAYSPRHDLLFLRNSASAVWVVDAKSQKTLGMQSARDKFTDISVAPDESVLFAADYGGTNIGYGTARQPSHVHRYDLAARKWETRPAPKIAFRLETVDADRFLLLEQDQWVGLSLNRWEPAGAGIAELARIGCSYAGDIEYDPRTGRVYHGNSGISSPEVTVRRVVGNGLKDGGGSGTYGTASKGGGGGGAALSADGTRFYYGRLQVEGLDIRHKLNTFPEVILAASRDVAFGKKYYYDAQTGKKVGDLAFEAAALTVSRDSMTVWAFNAATTTLHRYALEGER
jgi:hypothetical protein